MSVLAAIVLLAILQERHMATDPVDDLKCVTLVTRHEPSKDELTLTSQLSRTALQDSARAARCHIEDFGETAAVYTLDAWPVDALKERARLFDSLVTLMRTGDGSFEVGSAPPETRNELQSHLGHALRGADGVERALAPKSRVTLEVGLDLTVSDGKQDVRADYHHEMNQQTVDSLMKDSASFGDAVDSSNPDIRPRGLLSMHFDLDRLWMQSTSWIPARDQLASASRAIQALESSLEQADAEMTAAEDRLVKQATERDGWDTKALSGIGSRADDLPQDVRAYLNMDFKRSNGPDSDMGPFMSRATVKSARVKFFVTVFQAGSVPGTGTFTHIGISDRGR